MTASPISSRLIRGGPALVAAPSYTNKMLETQFPHLHDQRQSPIYTLPIEILSHIFREACPPDIGFMDLQTPWLKCIKRLAVVLCSISSLWRQVALSVPELWTSVILRNDGSMEKTNSNAALLRCHISYATSHGISLTILFEEVGENAPLYNEIASIIFDDENAHRIHSLRLRDPPVDWIPLLQTLPQIHTLSIIDPVPCSSDTSLVITANTLRKLWLQGINWRLANVPSTLRTLWLNDTPSNFNVPLLEQCPNLIECYSEPGSYDDWSITPATFVCPPTYHHLVALTWSVNDGISDGTAPQRLSLPALTTLHLLCLEEVMDAVPVANFIHMLSLTLTSLTLERFIEWDSHHYRIVFQHEMPSLHTLRMKGLQLSGLLPSIRALTPANETRLTKDMVFLSALRSLHLEPEDEGGEGRDEIVPSLRRMLRMRRAAFQGERMKFHIRFPSLLESKPGWVDEILEDFKEYFTGREIKMIHGSKITGWLSK